MKKISIITPMFNSFCMMKRNLDVLSKQKACDIELIIVDDCSKDKSYSEALAYAEKSDIEIKVVQNAQNKGPGYSRNNGMSYATGDYITFADSDDYFSEDFLEVLAPLLNKNIDCIIFDYVNVDEQGNKLSLGKSVGIESLSEGFIDTKSALVYTYGAPWGKIYRREVIFENKVQFAELFRNEDMPFTKHAIAMSESVYYCAAKLYNYVQLPTSLMHNSTLSDETNCQTAFSALKENLFEKGFQEELTAIELRWVLNNTVLSRIENKTPYKEVVQYIASHYTKQHLKNKYFRNYPVYVKIISVFAYSKNIFALSLITKYKEWKKKKYVKSSL